MVAANFDMIRKWVKVLRHRMTWRGGGTEGV
jgi:hypothetical protein